MLNHIVIMGRLTRDPELRYTQTQTPVASFTLAVDRDYLEPKELKPIALTMEYSNKTFGFNSLSEGRAKR